MHFYYYHFFRGTCPEEMFSKILFSIPYSLVREVIETHTKVQGRLDEFTKHLAKSPEETLRRQRENAEDIGRNRKRRKLLESRGSAIGP
jgi:hypothetical protein